MKTQIRIAAVAALLVAVAAPASQAVEYDVLAGKPLLRHRNQCSHVIDLMIHNKLTGGKLAPHVVHGPYGPHFVQPNVGDLEIFSVQQVCEATTECGPKFAITFTNNSKHDVDCFHISLVAVLGHIDQFDPTTTVKVDCLKAGETATLEIALPLTAMAMPTTDQKLAEFDTLVVALDAYDEFLECDECNNIQILKRAEIATVVVEEKAAVEAPATEGPQAEGVEPDADLPEAELPGRPAKPTPLDDIDLDEIQLDGEEKTTTGIQW